MMMFSTHHLPDNWHSLTDPESAVTVIDCNGALFSTAKPSETIARPLIQRNVIDGINYHDDPDFVGRHRLYEDFHNHIDVTFMSDQAELWRVAEINSVVPAVTMPFRRSMSDSGELWEVV